MEYDKRHVAYNVIKGGKSVPANKMINDLGDMMSDYIGTYSEFNPIGIYDGLLVNVYKHQSIFPKKDFKLKGFTLSGGLNTCGGRYTCNKSIKFSKTELLQICAAMDKDDDLLISEVSNYPFGDVKDKAAMFTDIKIITGI
jgi:hypothetical protein